MKWLAGKVIEQKEWSAGLYSLTIQAPQIAFIPGQFIQVSLERDQKLFRPYSLLNAPDEPYYEIYYTLLKQGKLTPQLATLSENSPIWISEKAFGRFTLAEVQKAEFLWCFATGTGLGAFLSMLKTKDPWQKFNKIVLVHSVRYKSELTHLDLREKWEKQYKNRFHWVNIVTREQADDAFVQRIPVLLENSALEKQLGMTITNENAQVMLCGNPEMVNQVTLALTQRGLSLHHAKAPGQITVENYWKNNP